MLQKLLIGISIFMAVQAAHGYDFSNSFTAGPIAPSVENKQSTLKARPEQASQSPMVMEAQLIPENSTPAAAIPVVTAPTVEQQAPAEQQAPEVQVEHPTSSEVVSGTPASTTPQGLTTSIRPQARPTNLNTQTTPAPAAPAAATATPAPVNTTIKDMTNCIYGSGSSTSSRCYGSLSTTARATRIMNAVHYINRLHGTHFDGRYMLCTGYRESNFNPGARGAAGERGMFQVMRDTARGALRYDAKLPGFKDMGTDTYLDQMKNSTLAQVELSFLVLQMKLTENADNSTGRGRRTRIMGGSGTAEDYRYLAGQYNGGGYSSTYARKISACYSCMRTPGIISADATSASSRIQACLNKAK